MAAKVVTKKATGLLFVTCLLALVLAAFTQAEVTQHGHLRVTFTGRLTPKSLPRSGTVPVGVAVGAKIATTNGTEPPQLRQISIAINSQGRIDSKGLPVCQLRDIQPSTTANAFAACRGSLVGDGTFSATVPLAKGAPFPSDGKMFAFNGRLHGRPVILTHVYGTRPVPTSYTLIFEIRHTKGTFGTTLTADLPATSSGFITGLSLDLQRTFKFNGEQHSYLSAGCPAPPGFRVASFLFARADFSFTGHASLTSKLVRSCKVR